MYLKNIIIIGAGKAGVEIAKEVSANPILGNILGFIDDDINKIGEKIENIEVFGPIKNFSEINKKIGANEAIIAIPSADKSKLNKIYTILQLAGIEKIKILPAISQVIHGDAHLILTREISNDDLLGREPINIPLKESLIYIREKRVLITGAGGSIGGEIARQLLYGKAERIYLIDNSENNLYNIIKELKNLQEAGVGEKTTIVSILCNLLDKKHLDYLLKKLKCEIIFHCAAYKHVSLMEENPVECIKNNVFGTKFLIESAIKNKIKKFILISTDKAVSPSCIYGASKLITEELTISKNCDKSDFIVVRFGNVLGSSGSIVPLFKSQIKKGGPVTVTDPKVSRYFMTISEATSLVLQTAGVGKGGNTYILDMGEPVLINDLAKSMIKFSGFKPGKDIKIKFIGLKPGEKLTEKLYEDYETISPTNYDRINLLNRKYFEVKKLNNIIKKLSSICFYRNIKFRHYRDKNRIYDIIKDYLVDNRNF